MGLDLWFREDVARILASTWEAMQSAHREGPDGDEYRRGVEDALRAVGIAFGLARPSGGGIPPRRLYNRWPEDD